MTDTSDHNLEVCNGQFVVPEDELNKPRPIIYGGMACSKSYPMIAQVSDNVAHYKLVEGAPMAEAESIRFDPLPDLIASVVYDVLHREGILADFTLADALNGAIDEWVEKRTFPPALSWDDTALLHALMYEVMLNICPAAEDCFSLTVNGHPAE